MSELTRRYARAFCEAQADGVALERTAQTMMEDSTLWEALCSPAVQVEEKRRVLSRLPDLKEDGLLLRFYCLLAAKGRMALLPRILRDVRELSLQKQGCALCRLTCAHPLEETGLEQLRRALSKLHHKRDIAFEVRVDPALLGGFTLELEGVTYDKSIRGALGRLRRQLEGRRMA